MGQTRTDEICIPNKQISNVGLTLMMMLLDLKSETIQCIGHPSETNVVLLFHRLLQRSQTHFWSFQKKTLLFFYCKLGDGGLRSIGLMSTGGGDKGQKKLLIGGPTVGFFDQFCEVQKFKIPNFAHSKNVFKFQNRHSGCTQREQKWRVFVFYQYCHI